MANMIRCSFLICLVLYTTLFTANNSCAQSVYMKQYTINDGLASNHVYMCDQDSKGYLWIATTSGLSRFDGKKFKNYNFESGMPDNEVLCVIADDQNNVWLNTFSDNHSLARIHNDTVETLHDSTLFSTISSTAYTNIDGGLYSRHHQSVYLNGKDYLTCIRKGRKPVARNLYCMINDAIETEDHRIFVCDTASLYQVTDTTISRYQEIKRASEQTLKMIRYYKGILYVMSEHAIDLYRYTDSRFVFLKTVSFEGDVNMLHCNQYGVWLAFTNQKGALLYKEYHLGSKPRKIAVPGLINFFTSDREGGVWVSTIDNGLFYLPTPDRVNYSISDGISSSLVSAIEPLSATECWLGFNTGKAQLVSLNEDQLQIKQTITPLSEHLSNNFVIDIAAREKGRVYFLNREGLVLQEKGRLQNVYLARGAKFLSILNDTLVGMGISGAYRLCDIRSGKIRIFRLGRTYTQAMQDGTTLWLGGLKGLFRLPFPSAWTEQVDSIVINALKNVRINKLVLEKGYLWVGTQNQGLYLLKGDSVVARFTKKNLPLLPSNTIKALAVNGNEIWIGTNWGLLNGKFDYAGRKFISTVKIDHHDGLLSPDVNEIRIKAANVFVATYDGFTILNTLPHSTLQYTIADVTVTNLADRTKHRRDSVAFNYDEKGFEIEFNAVSFRYNSELEYRYQLAPFDKEWKTTQSNLAQYTNIPPGNYRFQVLAYDHRGNQSLQAYTIFLTIQPRYWQSWWFFSLFIIIIILLILAVFSIFYRYQKRKAQQRIQQGRLIARTKLHALRAQLKPHFIYNSLNAIKDFIYSNKNEDAAELLQGFAGLIRKGVHLADKDFISIQEEAAFITAYLQLEQKKCDDCFDYTMHVANDLDEIQIPSLIIQPFVENAVIHGTRNKENRKGRIEISYNKEGQHIVCTIADSGIGITRSVALKKHYNNISKGISISHERIHYFKTAFDIEIRLSVQDRSGLFPAGSGTLVTITIINGLQQTKSET